MSLLETIFIIPIIAIGAAAAIHASAYIHGNERKHIVRFYIFFLLTLVAMSAVIFANSQLPFLLAWEAMGLASTGLVAFESSRKSVKKATFIYLLACNAGAGALMLAAKAYNLNAVSPSLNLWIAAFIFAVIGFGLKIGFPPFHSWLPEAHPAAPAPASAIMSGAMIPLGFYGLLKFFPIPQMGTTSEHIAGWTFLSLGIIGSIGGILFAMAQNNLKRLLAFSSVENMGIVAIGLGLGALAYTSSSHSAFGALAIGGALAHILNHAFLKGALFLGAGSILRQTGTLDLDKMGGLMRRMPATGSLFTINAIGLAGLPPLNGFIGELAIYISAFSLIATGESHLVAAGFLSVGALALSGGLAVATYSKAIGGAFLGESRTTAAENATETPCRMWIVQLLLTILSIAMVPVSIYLIHRISGGHATSTLITAAIIGALFTTLTIALILMRRFACPRGNIKTISPTWDCGYHEPTARMAYTATAFTQPLTDFFQKILRSRKYVIPFKGDPSNPTDAAIATETYDVSLTTFWRPIFTKVARIFQRAHLLQNGSLHLYILIILLALLALLIFALVS